MVAISVDVEADGPCPGLYSMVSFGAVVIDNDLKDTFYSGILAPISNRFIKEALDVSGATRIQMIIDGKDPFDVMIEFEKWVTSFDNRRPMFFSDNNGFDWQFINYYFHKYLGKNPFGHSSTNIGSLYKGLVKNQRENFKHLRKTKHTHHPVDDAKGNAEAVLHMKHQMGLR